MNARTAAGALAVLLPLAAPADPLTFTWTATVYQDAKEAPLRSPEGVACTAKALVVADTGNGRLLTFSLQEGGAIAPTGEVKLAQLRSPVQLRIDAKGNVLALDGRSRRIVRVDPGGGFGGYVDPRGAPADPAIVAFTLDAADNLYLLDAASAKVLVADPDGKVGRQVALPRGAIATDLAVDGAGTIYVVDGVGATVWSADRRAAAFEPLGKSLKDRMSFPTRLLAHQGKLVLVDQNGMGLVVLGLDGSYLGRQLAIGWNDGSVYYPAQLCINERGESFLADRGNHRVQQFSTTR